MFDCISENPPRTSSRVIEVNQLLDALRVPASAAELGARFFVGESTIRKVLRELEHAGHVRVDAAAPGTRAARYSRSVPPLRRAPVLQALTQEQLTRAELCALFGVNKVVMARKLRVLTAERAVEWTLVRPPNGRGPRLRRYRVAGTEPVEQEATTRYVPPRRTTRRLEVLQLLEREPLAIKQIAARLQCSSHTAYANIAALRDEQLVAGVPVRLAKRGRPTTLWVIVPPTDSETAAESEPRTTQILRARPGLEQRHTRPPRSRRNRAHRASQIGAILESGPRTIREVAAELDLSYVQTSILLAELHFSGLVQRSYVARVLVYASFGDHQLACPFEPAKAA